MLRCAVQHPTVAADVVTPVAGTVGAAAAAGHGLDDGRLRWGLDVAWPCGGARDCCRDKRYLMKQGLIENYFMWRGAWACGGARV